MLGASWSASDHHTPPQRVSVGIDVQFQGGLNFGSWLLLIWGLANEFLQDFVVPNLGIFRFTSNQWGNPYWPRFRLEPHILHSVVHTSCPSTLSLSLQFAG